MFGPAWPEWTADELRQIRQPIDFVGVNYYLRLVVRDDPAAGPARARAVLAAQLSAYRDGLGDLSAGTHRDICNGSKHRYGDLPLYITENGAAFDDVIARQIGAVDDRRAGRISA